MPVRAYGKEIITVKHTLNNLITPVRARGKEIITVEQTPTFRYIVLNHT
jgi:hypothetical protein